MWPSPALSLVLVLSLKTCLCLCFSEVMTCAKNSLLGLCQFFSLLFLFPFLPYQTNGYEEDVYGSSQSRKSSRVSRLFILLENVLLYLIGLKVIIKFFSVVKQAFPVWHIVGFAVCQMWRCSNKLFGKKKKIRPWVGREVSEFGTSRTWKPELLNL